LVKAAVRSVTVSTIGPAIPARASALWIFSLFINDSI